MGSILESLLHKALVSKEIIYAQHLICGKYSKTFIINIIAKWWGFCFCFFLNGGVFIVVLEFLRRGNSP